MEAKSLSDIHRVDIDGLAQYLAPSCRSICEQWFTSGEVRGDTFYAGGFEGGSGESLKVNLTSTNWSNSSTGGRGKTLVSLFAAVHGIKDIEFAYEQLSLKYGYTPPDPEPEEAEDNRIGFYPLIKPPRRVEEPPFNNSRYGVARAIHPYRDTDENLLFYVSRHNDEMLVDEVYLPWRWSERIKDSKWLNRYPGPPRPLYGLEKLGRSLDTHILVVSNEQAADVSQSITGEVYLSMTWAGGARQWKKTDWRPLHGRKVLCWPNADDDNFKEMVEIAEMLNPICAQLKIIDVTDAEDGWSPVAAMDAEWEYDDFLEWAKPRVKSYTAMKWNASYRPHKPWFHPGLRLNEQGKPFGDLANITLALEEWEEIGRDYIWFDTFHQKLFTRKGIMPVVAGDPPRPWNDVDTIHVLKLMEAKLGMTRLRKAVVQDALDAHAYQRQKNEVQEWINSLEWDEITRIPKFFPDIFGSSDDEYHQLVGVNFWVSIVARVMKPGCRLGAMVMLCGGKELRRSSALEVIGGHLYADMSRNITGPNFRACLRGTLIAELNELTIGNHIATKTSLLYDPDKDHPRKCMFVGTMRKEVSLDAKGKRRFWPVNCNRANIDLLKKRREQYFAEAAYRFREGEKWGEVPDSAIDLHKNQR